MTVLKRHKRTPLHAANQEHFTVQPIPEQLQRTPYGVSLKTILFCWFNAEHNLPFAVTDGLIAVMQVMFPDFAIAQGMRFKLTKCTDNEKMAIKELFENLNNFFQS